MLRRLILKNGGSNYLRYVLLLALPKTTTPIVVDLISYIYWLEISYKALRTSVGKEKQI
jgi:hypothetical protein